MVIQIRTPRAASHTLEASGEMQHKDALRPEQEGLTSLFQHTRAKYKDMLEGDRAMPTNRR